MASLTQYQKGNRLLVSKQYAKAIRHFESHAAAHPEDEANCHERIAECYRRSNVLRAPVPVAEGVTLVSEGNSKAAEHHFRLALDRDPHHFASLYGLSQLLPERSDERFELPRRAISIREDVMVLNDLGDYYRSVKKDLASAYDCYSRAVADRPRDETAYKKLRDLCRRMKRTDEAKEWSSRWKEVNEKRKRR